MAGSVGSDLSVRPVSGSVTIAASDSRSGRVSTQLWSAGTALQLFVLGIDACADGPTFESDLRPSTLAISPSESGPHPLAYCAAFSMSRGPECRWPSSGEVEVAVLRQVDDRGFVGRRLVVNDELVRSFRRLHFAFTVPGYSHPVR
jgi:hypothetical protein